MSISVKIGDRVTLTLSDKIISFKVLRVGIIQGFEWENGGKPFFVLSRPHSVPEFFSFKRYSLEDLENEGIIGDIEIEKKTK